MDCGQELALDKDKYYLSSFTRETRHPPPKSFQDVNALVYMYSHH